MSAFVVLTLVELNSQTMGIKKMSSWSDSESGFLVEVYVRKMG